MIISGSLGTVIKFVLFVLSFSSTSAGPTPRGPSGSAGRRTFHRRPVIWNSEGLGAILDGTDGDVTVTIFPVRRRVARPAAAAAAACSRGDAAAGTTRSADRPPGDSAAAGGEIDTVGITPVRFPFTGRPSSSSSSPAYSRDRWHRQPNRPPPRKSVSVSFNRLAANHLHGVSHDHLPSPRSRPLSKKYGTARVPENNRRSTLGFSISKTSNTPPPPSTITASRMASFDRLGQFPQGSAVPVSPALVSGLDQLRDGRLNKVNRP